MNKNRMEAFSDSVLAILITIMVLELKAPSGSDSLFSEATRTRFSELRTELYLPRYLLEQSPSSDAYRERGQWRNTLGKPASAFLVIYDSLCNDLDGSK
jgi:hypothetical protein